MTNNDNNPFGDVPKSAAKPLPQPPPVNVYFTASILKLVVMTVCTLGIYELYWFYKNWILIRQRTGRSLSPLWRATFAPFWGYALFKDIKKVADENEVENNVWPITQGLAFLFLMMMGFYPGSLSVLSVFGVLALIPANQAAVSVNQRLVRGFQQNDRFTVWNWIAMTAGVLTIGLFVISYMIVKPLLDSMGGMGAMGFDPSMAPPGYQF